MKKTPLNVVNEQFGSKEKLVDAVHKLSSAELWLDRLNSVKGLGKVSNAKLLRLHAMLTDAKKRFGSRDKLVGAILTLEKRSKDTGYQSRLAAYPLPRLLDLHAAVERRAAAAKAAAAKTAAKPPAKSSTAAKPVKKKAAAAKPAAKTAE
jgi:hypothetical protein